MMLTHKQNFQASLAPRGSEIDGLRFFAIGSVILYQLHFSLRKDTSRRFNAFRNPDAAQAFGPGAAGHPLWSALEQGWFGAPVLRHQRFRPGPPFRPAV
jgi:hypothetical protein